MIDDKRAAELMAAIDDAVRTTRFTAVDPEATLRDPTGPRSKAHRNGRREGVRLT